MERRHFLKYGTVAGTAFILKKDRSSDTGPEQERPNEQIEKVKRAMLSMQRQAWEQGVAAQAILESGGDVDLVVLMAREAVLRRWEDGRLGQVCDNHGVTDPGANGEAVLFAAKVAALAKIDSLGLVRGVCGSPEFSSPGVATEGQAFCLLMEAARADLNRFTTGREGA
jgi:hypothetical protein